MKVTAKQIYDVVDQVDVESEVTVDGQPIEALAVKFYGDGRIELEIHTKKGKEGERNG